MKYAIKGDPTGTEGVLEKLGPASVEESDYSKGKLVEVVWMTVAADGKTLAVLDRGLKSGRTNHSTLEKQP